MPKTKSSDEGEKVKSGGAKHKNTEKKKKICGRKIKSLKSVLFAQAMQGTPNSKKQKTKRRKRKNKGQSKGGVDVMNLEALRKAATKERKKPLVCSDTQVSQFTSDNHVTSMNRTVIRA